MIVAILLLGGHQNIYYKFYYRVQGSNERFAIAFFSANDTQGSVYSLSAETNYEILGVSCIPDDDVAIAFGNISVTSGYIVASENGTLALGDNTPFEFGVSIKRIIVLCYLDTVLLFLFY